MNSSLNISQMKSMNNQILQIRKKIDEISEKMQ